MQNSSGAARRQSINRTPLATPFYDVAGDCPIIIREHKTRAMLRRTVIICSSLVVSLQSGFISDAVASCSIPGISLLKSDSVALGFSGVVLETSPIGLPDFTIWQSVSINVDQVWKGTVPSRIVIFNQMIVRHTDSRVIHPIPFEPGRRYMVFAKRLAEFEKQEIGLPFAQEVFGTGLCAGGSRPFEVYEKELQVLGPGRSPQ